MIVGDYVSMIFDERVVQNYLGQVFAELKVKLLRREVLDGRRHMDSLCCEMEAPLAAAERAVLEAFPDCVWVHR